MSENASSSRTAADDVERVARGLDAADQAVIGTDLDGRILFWNEAAESLYGWSEAEVLGRDVIEVTPSELSRGNAAEIMERLTRGDSWSGRFVVRAKDGHWFTADVTDVPVRGERGELVGIVGISRRVELSPR